MSAPAPIDGGLEAAASSEQEAAASLRSLRLLLLLCALVPVLLFAAFGAYRWQQVHAEAELRLDRALRIAEEHALKVLETNETLLRHVHDLAREFGRGPAASQALHLHLKELAAGKPQIHSIWVLDRDGLPIASSRHAQPADLLASGDQLRRQPRPQGRGPVYFSDLLQATGLQDAFFDMSRARASGDGFDGTVSVGLSPTYFSRFHADLSANEPGLAITMFREDGLVYSRFPALASAPPRMAATSPVLSRVLAGQRSGVIRGVSSLDRNDRLLVYEQVGDYPVYLGTGLSLWSIREGWLGEMALLAAFAAVPALGLLLAGLAAMRRARLAVVAAQRLRAETQARLQMEEALRQAQKMEAVGRLTGGVAHDFNNALMVISANLHMLKLTQPAAAGRQTDAIARAVDSATKLTRQLLAFSRRQALMPEVLRLQDRLPTLRDLLAPVLGRQVEVQIAVLPGTDAVKVDWAELELALLNLAVNAKDAMPGGGSFRIEARNLDDPALPGGRGVLVAASDSGSGIPPEVVARVFEPFFTTKPVGEGTGLGLSQVYGFCQRSGGLARVRSAPGHGTTVEMLLPAVREAAQAPAAPPDETGAPLQLRVLMVEDNPDVAAAIRPVLESLGCQVTQFAAAAPALAWLEQNADAVDAVLTDVVMPGDMDGLALAQQVRRHHPQLRLVVMTGYAEHMDQITQQGFGVLAKPWTAANLARALREAAGQGGGRPAQAGGGAVPA